ncbi:hypothetical protein J6590_006209 [Homalodisca vitripennis]|nr:hypothetical protein J6590_006209 [Homalodisca vitripennis]
MYLEFSSSSRSSYVQHLKSVSGTDLTPEIWNHFRLKGSKTSTLIVSSGAQLDSGFRSQVCDSNRFQMLHIKCNYRTMYAEKVDKLGWKAGGDHVGRVCLRTQNLPPNVFPNSCVRKPRDSVLRGLGGEAKLTVCADAWARVAWCDKGVNGGVSYIRVRGWHNLPLPSTHIRHSIRCCSLSLVKDTAGSNPVCDHSTFYQYHRSCTVSNLLLILFDKTRHRPVAREDGQNKAQEGIGPSLKKARTVNSASELSELRYQSCGDEILTASCLEDRSKVERLFPVVSVASPTIGITPLAAPRQAGTAQVGVKPLGAPSPPSLLQLFRNLAAKVFSMFQ